MQQQESTISTKLCWSCGYDKPLIEFYNNKSKKDGLTTECKLCVKRLNQGRREKDLDRHRKSAANYYWKNKQNKLNYLKKYYAENYESKIKNRELVRRYGIGVEEYNIMVQNQQGLCKICKKPEVILGPGKDKSKPRDLSVDHCHKTKKIRGLLCAKCNTAIGIFKENLEALKAAIKYLEEHS